MLVQWIQSTTSSPGPRAPRATFRSDRAGAAALAGTTQSTPGCVPGNAEPDCKCEIDCSDPSARRLFEAEAEAAEEETAASLDEIQAIIANMVADHIALHAKTLEATPTPEGMAEHMHAIAELVGQRFALRE